MSGNRAVQLRHAGRAGVLLTALSLVAAACYTYAPFQPRRDQAVVITGSDVPIAIGFATDRPVGFRWNDQDSAWVQIPVQLDERVLVDFGQQPSSNNAAGTVGTVYGNGSSGVTELQYADPNTWVGADTTAGIDADDELAFMAADAGPQAPAGAGVPAGVLGTGRELVLTDPVDGSVGYVYLFISNSGHDQSAGADYVDYTFTLDAGSYLADYKRADGPNPESSRVVAESYEMAMSDRWIIDELLLTQGTGVDVLDGFKSQFAPSVCGRSNATFANAEGAFAANIDGPVRAIRSYIGANSGPLTQRTDVFYRQRHESTTNLRVHPIPAIMDFVDLSSAASGMEYGNSEMATTLTVDGSPDTLTGGFPEYEWYTGAQGSILTDAQFELSGVPDPVTQGIYYFEDSAPGPADWSQCWGDNDMYGASGFIVADVPETDPRDAGFGIFTGKRINFFGGPLGGDAATEVADWAERNDQPLQVAVNAYP